MNLYLIRHGEAYTKEENPDRTLNDKGKESVAKIAAFLKSKNVNIELVFHSEVTRATQTAEIIAKELNIMHKMSILPSLMPEVDVYDLIADVETLQENSLLVGHLPNLALLSNFLLTGNINKSMVGFSPATAVCLEKQDEWKLKWHKDPYSLQD